MAVPSRTLCAMGCPMTPPPWGIATVDPAFKSNATPASTFSPNRLQKVAFNAPLVGTNVAAAIQLRFSPAYLARNEVDVSEGRTDPGGPRPAMGCLCHADSRPRESLGVMDWRIEPITTPWKAWEVKSGFIVLRLMEVEGS